MTDKKNLVKLIGAVLAIILLIVCLMQVMKFSAENKAINLEVKVQNALEDTAVNERNRVDTVKTLADSTKSYTKNESRVQVEIAKARSNIESSNFEEANVNLNTAIRIISEAYPDLKSSELYKDFNKEVVVCNRKIEESRKVYNKAVREYEAYLRNPFWRWIISKTSYEQVEYKRLSESLGNNQDMPEIDWSMD